MQDTSFEYLDRYVTNLYSSRGMEDRLENDDDNGSLLVGFALVPKIIESCTKKIDLVTKKIIILDWCIRWRQNDAVVGVRVNFSINS